MGNGNSDSSIDVILERNPGQQFSEEILEILCSKSDHRIDSKHDAILSEVHLPSLIQDSQIVDTVPEVANDKHRIVWSEEGFPAYQELLLARLPELERSLIFR